MAQLIFQHNQDEQTLQPMLVLGYQSEEGEILEAEIFFNDGEVIQKVANAISRKTWHELFDKWETVTDCWIKGISIKGNTEKGNLAVHVLDSYAQASCIVNKEVLKDVNAQKIKEILEIAKRER